MRNSSPVNVASKLSGKLLFNLVISSLLVATPIYLYRTGVAQTDDGRYFFEAAFFWFIGLVFIFSSRYEKNVYLLHLIHHVFSKFAVIGGKYRTLIYGGAFLIVGCISIYKWLRIGQSFG